MNVPAGHTTQAVLLTEETWPEEQDEHDEAPTIRENIPEEHESHELAALEAAYLPAAQLEHALPTLYCPSGQLAKHVKAPT